MNELEWLRQMRDLGRPEPPAKDLWPQIAARIQAQAPAPATSPASRRHPLLPWSMAASVALMSLLAAGLARRTVQLEATIAPATATARWQPRDPRLSGAAIELEAARLELAQAMQQAPQATYLQRLLQRTQHQQMRLRRLEHDAG